MTAIQEGDSDGNEKTVGDPDWQPLINTPNYPDYTSGANNFTGAVTTILRLFFGTDEFNFTVTSNSPLVTTKTRTFSRFPEAADEVVEAREAFFLGATVSSGLGGASDCGDRPQDWPPKGHLQVRSSALRCWGLLFTACL